MTCVCYISLSSVCRRRCRFAYLSVLLAISADVEFRSTFDLGVTADRHLPVVIRVTGLQLALRLRHVSTTSTIWIGCAANSRSDTVVGDVGSVAAASQR